jgi:hypothetical protein
MGTISTKTTAIADNSHAISDSCELGCTSRDSGIGTSDVPG